MTAAKNRQVLLAARPHGEPTPGDFRLVEAEIPEPGPGQMLLRTVYLSLDPYMRGRMNAGPSYAPPVEVFARVPVCGLIAHYNATELPAGPDRVPPLMLAILVNRLTFRGFIVWDSASQYPSSWPT